MLQTSQFKERLEQDKTRLERMIESRQASAGSHASASVNDSFPDSGDDEYADAATDTFSQELDVTLLNKYRDRLMAVNNALGRLASGTYGRCIRCRAEIGEARLEAIPETPYCRDCESEVEIQD